MTNLQYKTYDQLMASVRNDLSLYDDDNLIQNRRYIKVAKTCNATLGLKLNRRIEATLEVEDSRADMPDDLLTVLGMSYNRYFCRPKPSCKGTVSSTSLNWTASSPYTVDIDERQFVFNFKSGRVSIYYLAIMEDEDGNLIVLDHDLTNDYYEWAIKEKIFQDLWHNNDADVQQKLNDARQQVVFARSKALRVVLTPEYKKLAESYKKAELDFYNRYVRDII